MSRDPKPDEIVLSGGSNHLKRELPLILKAGNNSFLHLVTDRFVDYVVDEGPFKPLQAYKERQPDCRPHVLQQQQQGQQPQLQAQMQQAYVIRNSDLKIFEAILSAASATVLGGLTLGKFTDAAVVASCAAILNVLRNVYNGTVRLSPEQVSVYSTLALTSGSTLPGLLVEDIEAHLISHNKVLPKETILDYLNYMTKYPGRGGPIELVYKTTDDRWIIRN